MRSTVMPWRLISRMISKMPRTTMGARPRAVSYTHLDVYKRQLSGCTSRTDVNGYPYRPTYILNGVGEIVTG